MMNKLAVAPLLSELTFRAGMLNRFGLSLLSGEAPGAVYRERFWGGFQILWVSLTWPTSYYTHGQVGEVSGHTPFIFNPKYMKIACKNSQIQRCVESVSCQGGSPSSSQDWLSIIMPPGFTPHHLLLIFTNFGDYQRENYYWLVEGRNEEETAFLFQILL